MRIAAFISVLCIGYATIPRSAIGMEAVTHCTLGSDRSHTLVLLRDHPIDSTAVYYLSKDGAASVRLYQGDEDQSRGQDIQIACVGTKERAFVISGEFNSNYLQGVAIRFNTKAKRWERVNFAERTRPTAVYFDTEGMAILIPNSMRNESDKRYIVYRYASGKDNGEQMYLNRLPTSQGVQIRVPESRSREK
ncbi:hypothetical protein [Paraburkholderia ginsengiterrae]|uniref:Uncharacterized protein n=1 Tax=Paraburkholderia ginsengiterrae TaxID=1462993 RepID=A0A1A9MZS5_9BURK|nr:hypothetical protein [Paraburkholderia ginsengiterrae]OAJ52869.1 hypothetical protein A6V37_36345 [Paraburkholderia ginsengiterrae]